MKTTMKTIKLEASIKLGASLGFLLGCVLATMVACSPDTPATRDAGSNESGSHDAGTSSRDAGTCTSARAGILGAACATCVETNCQTSLASCTADTCTRCLLGCTTCLSACTPDSGIRGDGGVPSASGDGGTASCDKIRNANCCAIAALVNLEAECQQAVDAKNDALCAALLTQTQNFAGRCQ